ncbi:MULTISPECIES: four-carbon acid sugar kinase family protein [Streptomyces]|uniref:Four-carbon acid sugar kinase family protein n=1 Tax=Streptomyces edwardsiae TaxID=3075527 RepID=A0ABU2QB17_9ACTN|nr:MULTISPECIES: four-carbon acid sugar kinase family protein [unclassified Streptomyces]MDT0401619.1 four-carbon acid sugar kinase family protein [Streptomyces sp. DSM 41635]
MCRPGGVPVVALADDLSGAAEVAALLRLPARLVLNPADLGVSGTGGEAVVVDLDSRYLDGAAAADAVRAVLGTARESLPAAGAGTETNPTRSRAFRAVKCPEAYGSPLWFKKCDSLLRGPVGAEAAAFAEGAGVLVIATALPAARRVVRGGEVLADGVPLHASPAWRAEERAAPRSVAEAMAPLPATDVPLETVRRGPIALAGRFREVAAHGRHPVCDAETDTDLTVIATAAALLGPGTRLLGSGGLAAALGRLLTARRADGAAAGAAAPAAAAGRPMTANPFAVEAAAPGAPWASSAPATGTASVTPPEAAPAAGTGAVSPVAAVAAGAAVPVRGGAWSRGFVEEAAAVRDTPPLLVVAGSAEPGVVEQVGRLVAAGARHVALTPRQLAGGEDVVLPRLAAGTVTVLSVDGSGGVRPGAARAVVAGLARTVSALPGRPDLVLTGGETARRVLDSLGVTTLRPVGEIHHGAVHSRTTDGRSVVTRPGSFGGPDSFVRIAAALRPSQQGVTQ